MTTTAHGTLGIDFGTSNSAMAWAPAGGAAQPLALEGSATAMPTAVFFNAEDRLTHFGRDAVAQYLAGTEGRLMRSLKSLLGSALLQDRTEVGHQTISFQDIIALFLGELRARAAQTLGHAPTAVVLGRPVHFVDDDPQRDAQAEQSLREAAHAVGFTRVRFQLEPIAAALDHERRLTREACVLVADIGGGTSDFTVVRLGPKRSGRADRSSDVLATTGVHIGGTDFDQKLSLETAMPLLGHRHLGPQGREVPSRVFFDLSTWHLIHWLYLPRTLAQAQALRVNYTDTRLHERLMRVLQQRDGHRLAHAVEQAKIQCSETDATSTLDLDTVDAGLLATLNPDNLHDHLQALLQRTVACAQECVQQAQLQQAGALDAIYLTGGSSALKPFQQALQAAFPGVPLVPGDLFGGVASGLAYSGR
ncbi:MAG: Hsp70 family protein [Hydrogenophaga sp.]